MDIFIYFTLRLVNRRGIYVQGEKYVLFLCNEMVLRYELAYCVLIAFREDFRKTLVLFGNLLMKNSRISDLMTRVNLLGRSYCVCQIQTYGVP